MVRTNPKLLKDLEIHNKILPKIDKTYTNYGSKKLKDLFNSYDDTPKLTNRRRLLSILINKNKKRKFMIKKLKAIHKLEPSIEWFFQDSKDNDLYFKHEYFNVKEILSASNYMKIYSPSLIIIIYLFVYGILKYNGFPVNIKEYFIGIYYGYKAMIGSILLLLTSNINMISFLVNVLSTMYVFYQLYGIYNSFESSMAHYSKCSDFRNNISDVKELIKNGSKILKKDREIIELYYDSQDKIKILNSVNQLNMIFSEKNISSLGNILLLRKNSSEFNMFFEILKDYIGAVDAFLNISRLVIVGGFKFPRYNFNSNEPFIKATGLWSLYVNKNEQVINDCNLDKPNAMILTGPNTSGKSTYIRNVMLAVLMAQSLGITCCNSLYFTPFSNLFTYLDIPNIARNKESLFEAEVHRCLEFCKIIENIPSNKFTFTIMDELFTGTNPEEGIASSYSVSEYLGHFTNSIIIITTHFHQLTELAKEYPNKFINKRFAVIRNNDGTFHRPYKIEDGVSYQNIAIELLRNKGYDSVIIERAISKLRSIEKKMVIK